MSMTAATLLGALALAVLPRERGRWEGHTPGQNEPPVHTLFEFFSCAYKRHRRLKFLPARALF
jgi:hypothetical protein